MTLETTLRETMAQHAPCQLAGVVEMGQLELPERDALRAIGGLRCLPLFTQPHLQEIQREGPHLVFARNGDVDALIDALPAAAGTALCGWVCASLAPEALAAHLAEANFAEDDASDERYLLRHYAPQVLPHLHARSDLSWQQWYFGPVIAWWIPAADGWRRLEGHRAEVSHVASLRLDEALRQALAHDPLPHCMVAELEARDPSLFGDACAGQRVAQVEQHLRQAREAGVSTHGDLTTCVVVALRHSSSLPEGWIARAVGVAQAERMPLFDAVVAVSRSARA